MKHKGFTVVELIVIIVVISILATITIISYSFLRGDSVDAKIKSITKTVGDAIALSEGQGNPRPNTGDASVSGGLDSLIPKYLKQDYRAGISSRNSKDDGKIIRWFSCADGGGGFAVFASLNNPTSENIDKVASVIAKCNIDSSLVPKEGDPSYNYVQVF